MSELFSIAIAKGRVFSDAVDLFEKAGYDVSPLREESRKLIFDLAEAGIRVLVVRSQDVPAYVERGAADAGVVGKDVLEEHDYSLYEPLDLKFSECRLMVAGPKDAPAQRIGPLRIATKYTSLATRHFSRKGIRIDAVHLYGAVELAPATGIADKIVDLVETGGTLRANGLKEEELVMRSTARFVVGRAALRLKSAKAREIIDRLAAVVPQGVAA